MTKKYIELILNEKIKHLGKDGDKIRVSMGYARNYLLPGNKASRITSITLKQIKASQKKYFLLKQEEQIKAVELKSKKYLIRQDKYLVVYQKKIYANLF